MLWGFSLPFSDQLGYLCYSFFFFKSIHLCSLWDSQNPFPHGKNIIKLLNQDRKQNLSWRLLIVPYCFKLFVALVTSRCLSFIKWDPGILVNKNIKLQAEKSQRFLKHKYSERWGSHYVFHSPSESFKERVQPSGWTKFLSSRHPAPGRDFQTAHGRWSWHVLLHQISKFIPPHPTSQGQPGPHFFTAKSK